MQEGFNEEIFNPDSKFSKFFAKKQELICIHNMYQAYKIKSEFDGGDSVAADNRLVALMNSNLWASFSLD